uniref:Uncharacterized protein n=1 Tax=Rhizophora mucronata TaxID=61149 RepID=A0A2P2IXS4_RHIMU
MFCIHLFFNAYQLRICLLTIETCALFPMDWYEEMKYPSIKCA